MKTRTFRFGFLAVLLALFAAAEAVAQDPAAAASTDGTNEGIAVHGHWTITIVRDGDVVERREFENDLTADGPSFLTRVLAREFTVSRWAILVSADRTENICTHGGPTIGGCAIVEGEAPPDELTVSTPDADLTMVLEGSAEAQLDATLLGVSTVAGACNPDVAPVDCNDFGILSFTATDLDPTLAVQSGDQIDVTVVLSFS
jgi:hypothetical protein